MMNQKFLVTFVGNNDLDVIKGESNGSSIFKLIDSLKITNVVVLWDRKESPEEFINAIAKMKVSADVRKIGRLNPMDYDGIFEVICEGLRHVDLDSELFYNMSSGTVAMKIAGFFLPARIKLYEASREQGVKEIKIPDYILKFCNRK